MWRTRRPQNEEVERRKKRLYFVFFLAPRPLPPSVPTPSPHGCRPRARTSPLARTRLATPSEALFVLSPQSPMPLDLLAALPARSDAFTALGAGGARQPEVGCVETRGRGVGGGRAFCFALREKKKKPKCVFVFPQLAGSLSVVSFQPYVAVSDAALPPGCQGEKRGEGGKEGKKGGRTSEREPRFFEARRRKTKPTLYFHQSSRPSPRPRWRARWTAPWRPKR